MVPNQEKKGLKRFFSEILLKTLVISLAYLKEKNRHSYSIMRVARLVRSKQPAHTVHNRVHLTGNQERDNFSLSLLLLSNMKRSLLPTPKSHVHTIYVCTRLTKR